MNLLKGKRSAGDVNAFVEEETEVQGDVFVGEDGIEEEASGDEEAPDWLSEAIEQGAISIPDEGPDVDIPHKDVGQDKPFKF